MNKLKKMLPKYIFSILMICCVCVLASCDATPEKGLNLQEMEDQMNSPSGCFSCQMFIVTYNTIGSMAKNIYPQVCSIALSFLALGLFAWILWHVLVLVTTLREPNLSQFWISLFQTLFKGGFIAVLVRSRERIYLVLNTVFEPIALVFIELSHSFLQNNWSSKVKSIADLGNSIQPGPGFPAEMGTRLVDLIYRITVTLNYGRVLSLRLMLGEDTLNYWVGLISAGAFYLMTIFFPLSLLDGLFRLAFVFTLLPLFLVTWVFKKTEAFLYKAWSIFISAFAQIMISCIFVSLCVTTVEGFVDLYGYNGLLSGAVEDTDQLALAEANQLLYPFLSFLFVTIYMYFLSKRVSEISAHFTGGPSSNIVNRSIEKFKNICKGIAITGLAVTASAVALVIPLPFVGSVASPIAAVARKEALEKFKQASKEGGDE